jgi:hypothetical protein
MNTITMTGSTERVLTRAEWIAEAEALFGKLPLAWRFVCPSCGHVARVADWHAAKAPEGAVAFSCVGRYTGATKTLGQKPGACNYAGGGLFQLNPGKVLHDGREHRVFAFAPRVEEVK